MLTPTLFTLLAAGFASAVPLSRRDVALNAADVAQAQVFDTTATRAFTNTTITTSTGQCLSVDPFSGDFRENLTPVRVVTCDGSANQTWDVITAGVHNNVPGQALIVSSLTNACLNFDPRRAAGNQVLLFSCGGRADGGGIVATSQLFAFNGGAGPQALIPQNSNNATCLTVINNLVDQTNCNGAASATGLELFTFGGQAAGSTTSQDLAVATEAATTAAAVTASAAAAAATGSDVTSSAEACDASTVTKTITVTVTDAAGATAAAATAVALAVATDVTTSAAASTTSAAAATTSAAADTTTVATTTAPISVSRAGVTLNPTAAAESNPKDLTATRAATGAQIKTSDGQCLSIDATAGDFRENLIPIAVKKCDGSEGQKFDFITKGVHNNQAGQTLIVSSLTNGCVNFDPRRAAGDQVIMFSCGGRADGSGQVNNSQLFPFVNADLTTPYALTPSSAPGVCFVNTNGRLTNGNCDTTKPAANELFTIVA